MYVSRIAQLLRAGLRRKVPHISRTGGKGMQMTGHAGFDKPQDCSVTVAAGQKHIVGHTTLGVEQHIPSFFKVIAGQHRTPQERDWYADPPAVPH